MGSSTLALVRDLGVYPLARKDRQSIAAPSRRKARRQRKQPSAQDPEPREPEPPSADSGRLQHRDHQRTEEPDHEPRRGEVSPGQEP